MAMRSTSRVEVGGRGVAFRSAGSGPPLLLLHGFLCDSRVWRRQLEGLSDRYTVIAWDAPGAGDSPDPPDPFEIEDWARVLIGFLDALGIDRSFVLGLSWGGLLAQELVRLDPARVERLILADTYVGWKGSFGEEVSQERLAGCLRDSALPGPELSTRWVPELFAEATPDLLDEMRAILSDFHPLGFRLMATSLAIADTAPLLPTIDVPTLLVWGEEDRRSPLDVAHQFLDALPDAELALIPGAGHVSNMEQPNLFNAHVGRFCAAG